jgi:hypothetical protein
LFRLLQHRPQVLSGEKTVVELTEALPTLQPKSVLLLCRALTHCLGARFVSNCTLEWNFEPQEEAAISLIDKIGR